MPNPFGTSVILKIQIEKIIIKKIYAEVYLGSQRNPIRIEILCKKEFFDKIYVEKICKCNAVFMQKLVY